jgi:hypothetical protein
MRYNALMTQFNRKSQEVVGHPLEEVSFEMPTVGDSFRYVILSPEYRVCIDGHEIETIIEAEGKGGYKIIILTKQDEFVLRSMEAV